MENFSLSIFNILSILALFAALLFVFQIYFLKTKSVENKLFSFYLFSISFIIVFFLILDLEFKKIAIALLPLFIAAVLSIGPLLWLYIRKVIGSNNVNLLKHLYVPIIFGGVSIILLSLILIVTNEVVTEIINQVLTFITIAALTGVFLLQNGYYIYQSLKLYKKYTNRIGEVFSFTEKVNLSWLRLLIYGYVVFIIGLVLANILDDLWSEVVFYTILFTYIIYSGYHAFKQEPVFDEIKEEETETALDLDSSFFIELKKSLLILMLDDKVYLEPSLTIHFLAGQLETNNKYLSQLINNEFNKSFVVFINEYRIEEAKRLLLDVNSKHLSIEGIGYEAGFKSKSAFNSAFKKFTGDTPSSFLKKGI